MIKKLLIDTSAWIEHFKVLELFLSYNCMLECRLGAAWVPITIKQILTSVLCYSYTPIETSSCA